MKVVKFGGSSLSDAAQIRKAIAIVKDDYDRRYMVVSAPGKRNSADTKVTDLLISLYYAKVNGMDYAEILKKITERFSSIITDLGILFDLQSEMDEIKFMLENEPSYDYIVSRGEYLNARIIAAAMHVPFVDAKDMIYLDESHHLIADKSYETVNRMLKNVERCVIPGFYGTGKDGKICAFSRGGSDISGAVIARGVNSEIYENWTDVNGFLTVDPRIVSDARRIEWISYRELRELSYMGASVLHEDAVFPLREKGITLNIRNTNEPDNPGTLISNELPRQCRKRVIAGIAGKKNLSNLQIEKAMMNSEVGFGAKVLQIIAKYNVPYEHTPTSIDTMSVLVETKDIARCRSQVLDDINTSLHPDLLFVQDGIAVVALVGEGMAHHPGMAARLLTVLAEKNINIRMLDVGFNEMTIILGIDESEYEKAVSVIYTGLQDLF